MPISARMTGILLSYGEVRKCSSISCNPSSNSIKASKPIVNAIDIPMADERLYLPPTQFQNWNIFRSSMPNSVTPGMLVDSAMKCLATSLCCAPLPKNQSLAVCAFRIVSCVVNDLLAIMNRVVSGFTFLRVSAIWVPSTLETK